MSHEKSEEEVGGAAVCKRLDSIDEVSREIMQILRRIERTVNCAFWVGLVYGLVLISKGLK